ncbi:ABC transporter permease [Frankia sp. AgB1.9]|uniref:ABC transporter permease n=1 Tax=unclassified Frankia TaxID=2632575 RepID=UPI0019344069|nr:MULTISPECIES: ABC transporter permease [unclassified Frankia]MBL7491547.1 ABC transporter permease [Frankia sp. AgW1.1]MBL7553811.1 ABC transporter permease [Frankia sp. AgB1.9]MBL7617911.1 ABC transporter permease [Frankia sp. AgB1.8]
MTTIALPAAVRTPDWIRRFRARPTTVLALLVVLVALVAAFAPGALTSHSPTAINLRQTLSAPSWHHLFGTDEAGRDLFTRVVYGTRESLGIGVGATAIAMGIAIVLGFAAGLVGGIVDTLITRLLEILFSFPALLLALLVVAVRGPSLETELIAVGVGSAPGYARMVRGQVLNVRKAPYVEAAAALGHRRLSVIRRHLFPNAFRPLVAVMTLGVGQSIVWASSLSFLGFGVPPPSPEWGALLDAGRDFITTSWWLEILPGLVIVLLAIAVTSLGRTLQHKLEGASR